MEFKNYKGVRDFFPKDMAVQTYIFSNWDKVLKSYGYQKYDSSILEHSEIYTKKTSTEIIEEQTYTFEDRGGRSVTLRPEMTPTTARLVAQQKIEKQFYSPLRIYSIPNIFRYESTQKGRLREHWQLNADVFGLKENAEVEMLNIIMDVFKSFGFEENDIKIICNDKNIIQQVFDSCGLSENEGIQIRRLIDKKNFENSNVDKLQDVFSKLKEVKKSEYIERIEKTLSFPIHFDPFLVRGFDYYDGIIFEVYANDSSINRSLAGGGKWDLSQLVGVNDVSAVGFGLGDVTLGELLKEKGKLPTIEELNSKYIYFTSRSKELLDKNKGVVDELRNNGFYVSVDYNCDVDKAKRKAKYDGIVTIVIADEDVLSVYSTNGDTKAKNAKEIINFIN